jgi:hypothetical protein
MSNVLIIIMQVHFVLIKIVNKNTNFFVINIHVAAQKTMTIAIKTT